MEALRIVRPPNMPIWRQKCKSMTLGRYVSPSPKACHYCLIIWGSRGVISRRLPSPSGEDLRASPQSSTCAHVICIRQFRLYLKLHTGVSFYLMPRKSENSCSSKSQNWKNHFSEIQFFQAFENICLKHSEF